jgi:hypothetical protein
LLCSLLHSPVASSLLGPNILLNTLSLCSSLSAHRPSIIPTHNNRKNYSSVYPNLPSLGHITKKQQVSASVFLFDK